MDSSTTPNVTTTIISRCGTSSGSASASTMERPPRMPPHVSTAAHLAGTASRVRLSAMVTATTTSARPHVMATNASTMGSHASSSAWKLTEKPMSRKTMELRANAVYSQKVATTRRVGALIPERAA